jgi:hypothetical protein
LALPNLGGIILGSISRSNAIEKFNENFGEKIENHFRPFLVGATIESLQNVEANYHVKGIAHLSNEKTFETHHRWTTQEEDGEKKEILEEGDFSMLAYFNEYLAGKEIVAIRVGEADRDDESYLFAYVTDQNCLEIPLGFDAEHQTMDSDGLAYQVIMAKDFSAVFS